MSLAAYRATRDELTMAERRELGQTIVHPDGVELVRGAVLVDECLREYEAVTAEGNEYLAISPFRSDYEALQRLIEADLIEVGETLVDTVRMWFADIEADADNRAWAITNAAHEAEHDDSGFLSLMA